MPFSPVFISFCDCLCLHLSPFRTLAPVYPQMDADVFKMDTDFLINDLLIPILFLVFDRKPFFNHR